MATHAGKLGKVYVGTDQVAEVRNFSIDETADTSEDTSMGDDWKTHLVTLKSWTAACDCWWDETDTNGQQALTTGASVTLNLYPEGNASGATYYTGTATVTSSGRSQALDGVVEQKFQFTGNGALTKSTVGA